MKVVYTDQALRDLDEILTFITSNYPAISSAFEKRLVLVTERIGRRPESAQEVEQRAGVRVAPLIRYPYKFSIESPPRRLRYSTFITWPALSRATARIRLAFGPLLPLRGRRSPVYSASLNFTALPRDGVTISPSHITRAPRT